MALESLENELVNNILMKNHSCKLLQFNNKKINKQIQKKIDSNEEHIRQNCKRAHSSLVIRQRLQKKLKEKK